MYAANPGWENMPTDFVHRDVSDVAVDAADNVYVLTRSDARIIVYDQAGRFVDAWGERELSATPHGLTIDADGFVWVADEGAGVVYKFSASGTLVLTIRGRAPTSPAGTGAEEESPSERFARPTAVAISASNEVYVSDGYGDSGIYRFSQDGEPMGAFGGTGSAPGEFQIAHDLCFVGKERLLVADRGNERIQLFTPQGELIDVWMVQRPNAVVSRDGLIYVGHSAWKEGNFSWRRGEVESWSPAWVSVRSTDGEVLAKIGGGSDPCAAGNFVTAHGVAVDSQGDVYVGDVTHSSQWRSLLPEGCPTLQKVCRV